MILLFTQALVYASMLWGSVWGGSDSDCGYIYTNGGVYPAPCDDGWYTPES